MALTKEPVCSQLQDLRNRLERLKASWQASTTPAVRLGWKGFQEEWREGWLKIEELLKDIEARLKGRAKRRVWEVGEPAILRFPPAEGVVSMGPF